MPQRPKIRLQASLDWKRWLAGLVCGGPLSVKSAGRTYIWNYVQLYLGPVGLLVEMPKK